MIPQNVSTRYVRNLLCAGQNAHFEIEHIERRVASSPEGIPVGPYWHAAVKTRLDFTSFFSDGATAEQAVLLALEKHGVTFK